MTGLEILIAVCLVGGVFGIVAPIVIEARFATKLFKLQLKLHEARRQALLREIQKRRGSNNNYS